MSLMDIGGGIGGFVGGLVGNSNAAADQARAKREYEAALAAWEALNPEAGQSQAGSLDPAARNAQMDALGHLQGVYQQGGMTLQDRVAQEQAMQASAMQERAQRGAIEQQMAQRGQGGGGAELAAKLMGAQTGAVASHVAGSNAAAMAQQRALEAMGQTGLLGGQVRGQDLQRAQAQDVMSRFNASQRTNKTAGVSGAHNTMGGYYGSEADRIRKRDTGMGQGLGASIGAAGDAYSKGGW